ncbi:MAG TPA: hypothetical protein EYP33_02565 [Pyrodictium sp.]|nr:hypothetical protein [Pyrodictium sp.]
MAKLKPLIGFAPLLLLLLPSLAEPSLLYLTLLFLLGSTRLSVMFFVPFIGGIVAYYLGAKEERRQFLWLSGLLFFISSLVLLYAMLLTILVISCVTPGC